MLDTAIKDHFNKSFADITAAADSPSSSPFSRQVRLPTSLRQSNLVGDRSGSKSSFQYQGYFERSLSSTDSKGLKELEDISKTVLFDHAIERISNAVAHMAWTISVPPEGQDNPDTIKKGKELTKALSEPNLTFHDTYTKLVKAIVRDLLVYGAAAIERKPANGTKSQPFWLFPIKVPYLKVEPTWEPHLEGVIPRYWYCPNTFHPAEGLPLYNKDAFIIQSRVDSDECIPPSPVQIAFDDMSVWLGLHAYQGRTASQAVRDFLICLEDETSEGLSAFREYWQNRVVGQGQIPIIAGRVNIEKLGPRNDGELFMQFKDYLTGLLALPFGLSRRDFGLTDTENRATAENASDSSFQNAILPIALTIIEHLNLKVINFFAPGYSIKLTNSEPRSKQEEAAIAAELHQDGTLTLNETRSRVGEATIPNGNMFINGSSIDDKPGTPPPKQEGKNEIKNSNRSPKKLKESPSDDPDDGDSEDISKKVPNKSGKSAKQQANTKSSGYNKGNGDESLPEQKRNQRLRVSKKEK